MYKGKFDQKSRQTSTDVKELLAQREAEAAKSAAKKSPPKAVPQQAASRPPVQNAPQEAPRKPAQKNASAAPAAKRTAPQAAPQIAPQPAPQAVPAEPKRRGPRLGGVIFYTLYFLFILIFFAATFLGLNWLNGWLGDYELSQPTVKAEQVFQQLFSDPDWVSLYEAAGAEDSPYEGKEEYVAYMENKMGDTKLTYLETSAGLSGNRKYIVRLGDEKIATFTLEDKNNVKSPSLGNLEDLENLEDITKIADWQLGAVEVFFQRTGSYRIVKMNGHKALVNGIELDDRFTIQIATTKAEEYLPAGTTGTSMCTQEITGLLAQPVVTVFDDKGAEVEVTYDPDTRTFTERTSSNTITPEQEDAVKGAAQTFCMWMIEEITDRNKVAKYFDSSSDTYKSIVNTRELWMQDHNGYNFSDIKVSDFSLYTDDLFSARISLKLNVTRTNGTVKVTDYASSMFFQKIDGKWLCIQATNVDITQPVGKVRLTFMVDDTEIFSNFFQTDATEVNTPTISPVPEGKVFSGWARKDVDDKGVTTWSVVFQPDETGLVSIGEGNTLEPMTLYALFEDASAVSASTGETASQTTEGGA